MFNKFVKIFIKNADDTKNNEVREKYGVLAGQLGIVLNLIMSAAKIIVGLIIGAISVLSDGINNLSDAGSSIITVFGFRLAAKKPDRKHPYGHGRMEYFAGLAVSAVIVFVAIELLKDSINKIIYFEPSGSTNQTLFIVTIVILAASVLIKFLMAQFNLYVSKKISSLAMRANYIDSISDCISTSIVLLCTVLSLNNGGVPFDGIAGAIVSIFIGYTGVRSVLSVISPLLGEAPKKETVQEIKDFVMQYSDEVIGVHDIMVHDYGPGRKHVVLHVEVSADGNIMELHDMIDNIERETENKFNCIATIHIDPVVTNSERVNELKKKCLEIAKSVEADFDIHDFRMNEGTTHANVIFDLCIPFESGYTLEQAKKLVEQKIKEYDDRLNPIIVAEHPMS